MTGDEIRKAYLDFFAGKGHSIIPSSSLIPEGDPTLLLTTAGMVQFKSYFMGEVTPPNRRLASCQKCFRTTDIESVGDANHLTFFEMLGNFSIGDYFKRESINWAWEFVTKRLALPRERLWITVFLDDDEAASIWRELGVPENRIVRFGEKDNFWGPAGSSGPCGPCSEIHYDFGTDAGCRQPSCALGCRCGRFSEIWNLVFTQFNQDVNGKRTPLPRPNIDTGMGLERITTIMQGKNNVYETDIFSPLIATVSRLSGKRYGVDAATDNTMRIIAEHGRGITFLIADGVMPSNEGRGYVLRRLLRRADYFGETLSHGKPFITEVAKAAIEKMGHVYPELVQNKNSILEVIESELGKFRQALLVGRGLLELTIMALRKEIVDYFPTFEKSFMEALSKNDFLDLRDSTRNAIDHFRRDCQAWGHVLHVGGRNPVEEALKPIDDGLTLLEQAILEYSSFQQPNAFNNLKQKLGVRFDDLRTSIDLVTSKLTGYEAFILHDTYGFPVEMTTEIAAQRGFSVDTKGFEQEMAKQRERARAASRFDVAAGPLEKAVAAGTKVEFTGYEKLECKSKVLQILADNEPVDTIREGQTAGVILDVTPFYGEMGGQVGDIGRLIAPGGEFSVTGTVHLLPEVIIHHGRVIKGTLKAGDEVKAEVDRERRLDIARNHTATHLLHAALREVLGEHAQQKGSLVAPDRLRFDFSHLKALTAEELSEIQRFVNDDIRKNMLVLSEDMSYRKAVENGAIALFNEKYGDMVRVVMVGEPALSTELCGGTHISATGEIGFFQIISESSIGAGLRRIEAVTGRGAEEFIAKQSATLEKIASSVGATAADVEEKVSGLSAELNKERRQRQALEKELSRMIAESLLSKAEVIGDVKVLAESVPSSRIEVLREMSDILRDELKSAIIVLGTVLEDKPAFLAVVTPDLVAKGYNAGDIVRKVAQVTGGGGGGRPNIAQAGGRDKSKLEEALKLVKEMVKNK